VFRRRRRRTDRRSEPGSEDATAENPRTRAGRPRNLAVPGVDERATARRDDVQQVKQRHRPPQEGRYLPLTSGAEPVGWRGGGRSDGGLAAPHGPRPHGARTAYAAPRRRARSEAQTSSPCTSNAGPIQPEGIREAVARSASSLTGTRSTAATRAGSQRPGPAGATRPAPGHTNPDGGNTEPAASPAPARIGVEPNLLAGLPQRGGDGSFVLRIEGAAGEGGWPAWLRKVDARSMNSNRAGGAIREQHEHGRLPCRLRRWPEPVAHLGTTVRRVHKRLQPGRRAGGHGFTRRRPRPDRRARCERRHSR